MRIGAFIQKQKKKFRSYKTQMSHAENIKKAEELQKLRQERIKAEGKAELEKARQSEIKRIEAARKANPSKLQRFGMGIQKVMKEQKAKSESRGLQFGGSSPFGSSGSSPFSNDTFGPKKETTPQPKYKTYIAIGPDGKAHTVKRKL